MRDFRVDLGRTPLPIRSVKYLEHVLGWDRARIRLIASRAGSYYHPFTKVQKKPDGTIKERPIDNPSGALRAIQGSIYHKILRDIVFPSGVNGGVRGRSIRDNAVVHVGARRMATIDLADCFPRTTHRQVYAVFRDVLGCSPKVAGVLTRLTTYHGHLPQGAPTSTILADLCLLPLYGNIREIAGRNGLSDSAFIDDVGVSGDNAVKSVGEIVNAVHRHRYSVRARKVKRMYAGSRHGLTGAVTNTQLSVSRVRRKAIRGRILSMPKGTRADTAEVRSIKGMISSVRVLSSRQADTLEQLLWTRIGRPEGRIGVR